MKVNIGNLNKAVNDMLETYCSEVAEVVDEALPKVGQDAVKELKQTSPNRTGDYAKGWAKKVEKERLGSRLIVYNKTRYQLTHLLEKGHAKVGGGFVPGKPHIKPAQDKAEKKAMDLIEEGIKSVK
jgi:hypothetical protein